jgi:putative sterol carrier protein
MPTVFPSSEWLKSLESKLNNDEQYAQIAKNWEGDICFVIEPTGSLKEELFYYVDLWHGKCKRSEILEKLPSVHPTFIMTAKYDDISQIMNGELNPITALMTRKLQVQGSMIYLMRNVPTVLDFVRCAREITSEVL